MDRTALSLCLPFVGRNVFLLQEQERGSNALVQVWEVQESQERSVRVSEFLLALQRAPALCVAPISGKGYHHLLSTWHTFCQPESQAQLFMNNAN